MPRVLWVIGGTVLAGLAVTGALVVRARRSFPKPRTVAGLPMEVRRPEKADDRPAFPGQTRAPYEKSVDYTVTRLTDGLKSPWSLAFLPDGKMLITEKPGQMVIFDARTGGLSAPLGGVPAVSAIGQVGLLDVALDPKFGENHRIFFSYTEPVGADENRIVMARATLDEAAGMLREVQVIFRAQPVLPRRLSTGGGGRIAIDRDGNVFLMVGDRSESPPWDMAQRLDNDLGKVIHVTPEGAAAGNNPFLHTPGALPEIWSYGHRNAEGLVIHPVTGELWETEHGPKGGDELNVPEAGKNYGWPVIVHGVDYTRKKIGEGITEKAGMEQPLYYWDPVIAPSGLAVYEGELFPRWKGNVFVGALYGTLLDRLQMDGRRVVAEEPLLVELHQRIRDVRVGPDGALYVLTDTTSLLKLTPKQ